MFNQVTIILRTSSWQKIPLGKLKEKCKGRRICWLSNQDNKGENGQKT